MPGKSAAAVILLAALTGAQTQAPDRPPLQESDLKALHEAGLPAADLLGLIERQGAVEIDAQGSARLREAGLPPPVLDRLARCEKKPEASRLSAADVAALVRSGVGGDEVIRHIEATDSRFDLTIEQVVQLVRDGVPAPVIKVMRERSAAAAAAQQAATTVTLDDLLAMAGAGIPAEEMLRRIRKTDARFTAGTDELIRLSRGGVPTEVLKEVWNRKASSSPAPAPAPDAPDSSPDSQGASAPTPADGALVLATHREPSGGFSVNVPQGWFLHRESVGANSLLSFTDHEVPKDGAMADAEVQVFRYRSPTPDRLTESNLEAIAGNFLGRLQASFAARKMSLTFGRPAPARISGRPALASRVASSGADGTTHEGEVCVTWQDDQVFVISFAVRAEKFTALSPSLGDCVRSFTLEVDRPVEIKRGRAEDVLPSLFAAWKDAVSGSDFALYRKLCPGDADTARNRAEFVKLARRLGAPGIRLGLGTVRPRERGGEVDCLVIGPDATETLTVAFTRDGDDWRLDAKP